MDVSHRLEATGELDAVGGPAAVIGLAEATFTTALVPHASWRLRLRTARRELQTIGAMVIDGLSNDDAAGVIARVRFFSRALQNLEEHIDDGKPS